MFNYFDQTNCRDQKWCEGHGHQLPTTGPAGIRTSKLFLVVVRCQKTVEKQMLNSSRVLFFCVSTGMMWYVWYFLAGSPEKNDSAWATYGLIICYWWLKGSIWWCWNQPHLRWFRKHWRDMFHHGGLTGSFHMCFPFWKNTHKSTTNWWLERWRILGFLALS